MENNGKLRPVDPTEFALQMQQDKQDKEKATEQGWADLMKKVIQSIELQIADHLSQGRVPLVLLGNPQSIHDIHKYYFGDVEVKWEEGVGFTFGSTDEKTGVILVVYRTVDLPYGKLRVV